MVWYKLYASFLPAKSELKSSNTVTLLCNNARQKLSKINLNSVVMSTNLLKLRS